MKPAILALAACAPFVLPGALSAATVTLTQTVDSPIPDNDGTGLVSIIPFLGSDQIVSVEVQLELEEGWNGDLYAYLEHNGVISVLLNRVGNTVGDPGGSGSSGMSIRFSDAAAQDVHTGISGAIGLPATGTYQPDARFADPDFVTDLSPRSRYLAGFNGTDPSGLWTLFIADVAGGDTATIKEWSLTVTTVPEPSAFLLGALGAAAGLARRQRRQPQG